MGGFAVDIDWDRPPSHGRLDTMLALIPHRSTGGVARSTLGCAALGEGRTGTCEVPPTIVTDGRFSIVGDLRLWETDALRSRAGGIRATRTMDDRQLLIAAYARTGIGFLNDVDGDFAFVIWDNERRRALAVRDRFAAKPLCYEATPTGIRFATEVKQLVATSARPLRPNEVAIAEYLTGRYEDSRRTFFAGVARVGPAHYLLAERGSQTEREYWAPSLDDTERRPAIQIAEVFREHLTDAVRRRASTSTALVSHLSGGLDSSSITAAATIAADRDTLTSAFSTISAVFPGTTADESPWIREIAAGQPFTHHDFVPEPEQVAQHATVMWQADSPIHNRIRGIWSGTATIAASVGADLVLMGSGGDEVAEHPTILADLLRRGMIARWWNGVNAEATWRGSSALFSAEDSIRRSLPVHIKRPISRVLIRPSRARSTLATNEFLAHNLPTPVGTHRSQERASSETQRRVAAITRSPVRCLLNDTQEAEYSYNGVAVSYPFLDRRVVELVTSIPPERRPFDGSRKALIRAAFADHLPASVLNRRNKTLANGYLAGAFSRLSAEFANRYPRLTDAGTTYLDESAYKSEVRNSSPTDFDRDAMWRAWTLMLWLEGLDRYRERDGSVETPSRR